jgi:hypothetical protein
MQFMAAGRGWTGVQWTDLFNVEMREAGFNLRAQNPTSRAYGLAQFINGPSEYYSYGGDPNTAVGQITGMFNYIAQRYGTPAAAWAHELGYGWYEQGGSIGGGGMPLELNFGGRIPNQKLGPMPSFSLGRSHEPPARQLSAAGAAGGGSGQGFHVGEINIHNPVKEQAGTSLTHAVQRLAFLAGRGPV